MHRSRSDVGFSRFTYRPCLESLGESKNGESKRMDFLWRVLRVVECEL